MSDEQSDRPDPADDTPRRTFLTKSALFLALVGVSDAFDVDAAQPPGGKAVRLSATQVKSMKTVVTEAQRSGNIQEAITTHGKGLPAAVRESLGRLTSDDLKAIATIQSHIGDIEKNIAADNNGVVIM